MYLFIALFLYSLYCCINLFFATFSSLFITFSNFLFSFVLMWFYYVFLFDLKIPFLLYFCYFLFYSHNTSFLSSFKQLFLPTAHTSAYLHICYFYYFFLIYIPLYKSCLCCLLYLFTLPPCSSLLSSLFPFSCFLSYFFYYVFNNVFVHFPRYVCMCLYICVCM